MRTCERKPKITYLGVCVMLVSSLVIGLYIGQTVPNNPPPPKSDDTNVMRRLSAYLHIRIYLCVHAHLVNNTGLFCTALF